MPSSSQKEYTEQNILNNVYDEDAKALSIQQKLNDGQKQKYHSQLLIKKYPNSNEAQKIKSEGL